MRAQVAFEFIMFMITAIVGVIVFLVIAYLYSHSALDAQKSDELNDLADSVKAEFILAAGSQLGYHRYLDLPLSLRKEGYEVVLLDDVLYFTSDSGVVAAQLVPHTIGSVQKGQNILMNNNGTLYVTH